MTFSYTGSTKRIPTHLKYISENPDQLGKGTPIKRIMYNDEWLTITFFGEDFKFNIKHKNGDDLMSMWFGICELVKKTTVKAYLIDQTIATKEDDRIVFHEFVCDIEIKPVTKAKGGIKGSINKGIITL